MKLMATPANIQQPGAVLYDGAGEAYLDTTVAEDACGNPLRAMGPSACIFLVRRCGGSPRKGPPRIESVSNR